MQLLALYPAQILVDAFLAILFLQSSIDKMVDRRGNIEWLTGHFAKSPLAGFVPLLVTVITIFEFTAGALSGLGCVMLIVARSLAMTYTIAFYGAIVSALSILCLFFGQRMAKEYPGAAVLVPYFLLSVFAIFLFS